jgi:hypothetical protein
VLRDQTGRTNWKASGCMQLSVVPVWLTACWVCMAVDSLAAIARPDRIRHNGFLILLRERDALHDEVPLQKKKIVSIDARSSTGLSCLHVVRSLYDLSESRSTTYSLPSGP